MMPFSRGRRMEMGLCIRQQSIPEKLIPPEAENGREQKKRGKSEDGPVHDPGAVIRNILFRKRSDAVPCCRRGGDRSWKF